MKSKKKIIAIIISLIVVIAGGIFAYLYFFTDMFKTPEELFYQYIGKAAQAESQYDYQDMLEELKNAQTKSYVGKSTVGLEINSKGTSYSTRSQQAVYDEVNKVKLNLEEKSAPSQNKFAYNIGIDYDNKNIAQLELVKNNDLYGVKSDFLDDKYIAVENNNLKALAEKFGLPSTYIPDKIEFLDIYELLYISKEDQDKIVNTYKDIIRSNISSDKFKKVENVVQKVNNEDKNTTVYALGITEKEFLNVIIKVLETAKQDDTTLNLIVDKVNTYLEGNLATQAYNYTSYSLSPTMSSLYGNSNKLELTKEDLVDGIEELIDDLNDEIRYADEKSVTEIAVYVADGKTVRIEFRADDEVQIAIDFYTVDDKEHIVLYSQETSYSSYSSYSKNRKLTKQMEIEYKTAKNGDETKAEGSLIIYDDEEENGRISFETTLKGKVGEGKNESTYKITIDVEDISFGINVDAETEYTDSVNIEDLNETNATILNNMTQTEMQEFFTKVGTTFQQKLITKMEEFGLQNEANSLKATMPTSTTNPNINTPSNNTLNVNIISVDEAQALSNTIN